MMTIYEAKKRKKEIERRISTMLINYQKQTGMIVEDIEIEYLIDSSNVIQSYFVKIKTVI